MIEDIGTYVVLITVLHFWVGIVAIITEHHDLTDGRREGEFGFVFLARILADYVRAGFVGWAVFLATGLKALRWLFTRKGASN